MIHYFDVDIAKEYGIEEAILIQNFAFWIGKNAANGTHFHDGRYWTYCSASTLLYLFPEFNSLTTVKRIVQNIVDKGILQKGNYNKTPMDRTAWYAFTDKGVELIEKYGLCKVGNQQMQKQKPTNGESENGRPIPYNITDNITDNNPPVLVLTPSEVNTNTSPKGESERSAPEIDFSSESVKCERVTEVSKDELEFDKFRKEYRGTKRGLKTEFDNFKKKHRDWKLVLPLLKACYDKQTELKDAARQRGCFVPQEKNLQTYINQRCWEEEPQFSPPRGNKQEKTVLDKMREAEDYYQFLNRLYDSRINGRAE